MSALQGLARAPAMVRSLHYESVAKMYSSAFFYEQGGAYETWQLAQTSARLRAAPHHALVDLGGGQGRFAQLLHARCALRADVLCVDPSEAMLREAEGRPGVRVRRQDAAGFAARADEAYDRVLLKEIVHHLGATERRAMYADLHARLPPGGLVVTATRPHEPPYPFFEAASDVWRANQPEQQVLAEEQESAGFRVACDTATFPVAIELERWKKMVSDRFWSTFADFTPEELAAGVDEIEESYGGGEGGEVTFDEQLVFIVAEKA